MDNIQTISASDHLKRLDKWLVEQFDHHTRAYLQKIVEEGFVLVNDNKEKNNYKLKVGDEVKVSIPELKPLKVVAEDIPLTIIYEDEDVLVVDKPSGMVVHPSNGHQSGTLVNALLFHCKTLSGINGIARPGIVHRIDKDTSGLLMVAKNDRSHQSLSEQLSEHSVTRSYTALVYGLIPHDLGQIKAPIGRDLKDRQKMAVVRELSKPAVTHFKVVERFKAMSLVTCRLETGRTHQIRVHMAYIGFPIFGDPKYAHRHTPTEHGQYLHASLLGFKHPVTGAYMEFTSPLPHYFEEKLSLLREEHK